MDGFNSHAAGGSLQISSEVIEKIARQAAMEIEGVHQVAAGTGSSQSLFGKLTPAKAVSVEMNNEVADIQVSLVVEYGTKIPEISEKVQKNVKNAVQNMTSIIVGKVDLLITGIAATEMPAQGE